MAEEKLNDHDLLIKLSTTVELGFKNINKQIEDLKDGTTDKISDLYSKYEALEKWKTAHETENKDATRSNANYMKALIAIGIMLAGLLIYHLTGYHI